MKQQVFTTVLALSLAASLALSSLADQGEVDTRRLYGTAQTEPRVFAEEQIDENGYYNDDDGYAVDDLLIGPFAYESDDKNLELAPVQYGETAYFLLTGLYPVSNNDGKTVDFETLLLSDSDSVDGLKVKTDWEEGDDEVDSVAITKKKVNHVGVYDDGDFVLDSGAQQALMDGYGFSSGDYYYMVAITVEESDSTADADVIGTLTLDKSRNPDADEIDFDVAITVDWEESYRENDDYDGVSGDIDVEAETYYSIKFDGDDEIEIAFEDDSTFTVDISGQNKTLLYYDTNFDSEIAARYPLAELNFWNGNGAKFNRTGDFFLAAGDDADYAQFLYQIHSDGTLSEVSGAEYDEADEGFYLNTRVLGRYVYSDTELDLSDEVSPDDDGADAGVIPVEPVVPVNPGTGAGV